MPVAVVNTAVFNVLSGTAYAGIAVSAGAPLTAAAGIPAILATASGAGYNAFTQIGSVFAGLASASAKAAAPIPPVTAATAPGVARSLQPSVAISFSSQAPAGLASATAGPALTLTTKYSVPAGTQLSATPSTLASVFASAAAGNVIMLGAGNYGTFNGGSKTGWVYLRPVAGATVTIALYWPNTAYMDLAGVIVTSMSVLGTAAHLRVSGCAFSPLNGDTGRAVVDTSSFSSSDVVLDSNTHLNIFAGTPWQTYPARLQFTGSSSYPMPAGPPPAAVNPGVTVSNSLFGGPNGDADGVRLDVFGITVTGCEFTQFNDIGVNHCDPLQFFGGYGCTITRCWFHDMVNCSAHLMMPDGTANNVITDNVFAPGGEYFNGPLLGSDQGSLFAHNTHVYGNNYLGTGNGGQPSLGSKPGGFAGTGTIFRDSILTTFNYGGGGDTGPEFWSADHDMFRTTVYSGGGMTDGGGNITGTPVYTGGASPAGWAGYALSPGSPGSNAASDGTNAGIRAGTVAGLAAAAGAVPGASAGIPASWSNSCEGPAGAAVTTSNSAGPTQFGAVTTAGSGTLTYSGAHAHTGSASILVSLTAAAAGQALLQFTGLPAGDTQRFLRLYVFVPAATWPSDANVRLCGLANALTLRVGTGGALSVYDGNGALAGSTTGSIPVAQWVRVEFDVTAVNWSAVTASAAVRMFSGTNVEGTTPDNGGTLSLTGVPLVPGGGTLPDARFGVSTSATETNGWQVYIDDLAVSDQASPGPLLVPGQVAPPAAFSAGAALGASVTPRSVYPSAALLTGAALIASGSGSAVAGWADGTTSGYEHEPSYPGSLADGSAITITSGATYAYYHDVGGGQIGTVASPVSNVTFVGCAFTGAGTNAACAVLNGTNITFRYCTFQPGPIGTYPPSTKYTPVVQSAGPQWGVVADGTSAAPGSYNSYCYGLTLDHCEAWGFGNGMAKLAEGSSQAQPYIVKWCYMHNHRQNTTGTDHQDGIGSPGGGGISYLQLANCQINESYLTADTGAIAWAALPSGNNFDHCSITGNLFGGYGLTIGLYVAASVTQLTFTDNTFSTQYPCAYGPLYDNTISNQPGFTWHRNKWHVPAGAAWGHQAYDGYFWLPGYTSNANVPGFDELAAGLCGLTDN